MRTMLVRRATVNHRWRCFFLQSFLLSSSSAPLFVRGGSTAAFQVTSRRAHSPSLMVFPGTRYTFRLLATNGHHESYDWDSILPFEEGSHNSAKISIPAKKDDGEEDEFEKTMFGHRIEATISACQELKKSSIWVEVPMCRASLIEEMVEFGLKFHHAKGDTANLCRWLDQSVDNKIPEYATHHVGVGAIVVNSRDEILCVRELGRNYMPWKVPGGLAELGEQLDEAAVREVMEETGVPCRFLSVLCVRHTHGIQFGRSDLYFLCRLEPIEGVDAEGNTMIPEPIAQASEIEKTAWVPLEEYKSMVNSPDGHPMMKHIMKLYEQDWEEFDLQKTVVNSIVPGRKASPIYHTPLRELQVDETER